MSASGLAARPVLQSPALAALLLLLVSLLVMAGLFLSVHARDLTQTVAVKEAAPLSSLNRWDRVIQGWLEQGFVRQGGMIFFRYDMASAFYPHVVPPEAQLKEGTVLAWKNSTASWLIPAYVIQRTYRAIRGGYSYRLMFFYNQLVVALIAAALGFLAMQLSGTLGASPRHAFLLGCSSLLVYQTFPINLWSFWEVHPLSCLLFFVIVFLTHEYGHWNDVHASRWRQVRRCALATLIIFGEPVTGGLFVVFYLLMRTVLEERGMAPVDMTVLLIVPVILVACYLTLQQLLVKANFASVIFVGSTVQFRTGLSGSTAWFRDHWDLLFRGRMQDELGALGTLTHWPLFFTAGLASFAGLLVRYRSAPVLQEPLKILIAAIGLYVPVALAFAQVVYIHPYYWDACLVIPCILAVFCLLPAWIETHVWPTGLAVLAATMVAAGYAFIQMRTYAVAYPIAP